MQRLVLIFVFDFFHIFFLEDGPLDLSFYDGKDVSCVPTPKFSSDKPTLHEVLIAEKLDFEMKVQRATRRKKWLKGTFWYLLYCHKSQEMILLNL